MRKLTAIFILGLLGACGGVADSVSSKLDPAGMVTPSKVSAVPSN